MKDFSVSSFEVHVINAGSILGFILFLLYINDQPRNILRSLVNIYADNTTAYECTSQNPDDQSLSADLSSGLAITNQGWVYYLVTFNTSKTKQVTIHHSRAGPTSPEERFVLLGLRLIPYLGD